MKYLQLFRKAIKAHLAFVVLDTETTGLGMGEICQIAIVDHQANVLLDTLVKTHNRIPAEATAIHGITDDMVAEAPTWVDVREVVHELTDSKLVIVYNQAYDVRLMAQSDRMWNLEPFEYRKHAHFECAMEAFAEYYGVWNDYHSNYRWQTLTTAAAHVGYEFNAAHTALADCKATLAVTNYLISEGV